MIELILGDLAKAIGGSVLYGDETLTIRNISIDSRNIKKDSLFIPIQGKHFDGHNFIQEAISKGVTAILTSREMENVNNVVVIRVENTLIAMQKLANYILKRSNIPVVAITGSYGKTSTKDMIAGVLEQKFNVLKTQGNFNNDIGVPLTVFQLEREHQIAVIEMGMSGLGEIRRLTKIVEPDIALITNIGVSHIEDVGSQENIFKAKVEIIEGIKPKGLLLINADDKYLKIIPNFDHFTIQSIASAQSATYKAENIVEEGAEQVCFEAVISGDRIPFRIPVPGTHNVYNALMAIAVGVSVGLSIEQIQEGIQKYAPSKMRQTLSYCHGICLINDAYNASPQTMISAIQVLQQVGKQGRTIAVLGDMLSLGDMSKQFHHEVGRYIAKGKVNFLIAMGKYADHYIQGAITNGMLETHTYVVENHQAVIHTLQSILKQGDTVLIKASRSMKMEMIVEAIEKGEGIQP